MLIVEGFASQCIIGCGVFGLCFCWFQWQRVSSVQVTMQRKDLGGDAALLQHLGGAVQKMKLIGDHIAEGAWSFLMAEFGYLSVFALVFFVIVWLVAGLQTAVAFLIGCAAASVAGLVGITVATKSNYRTTHECWRGLTHGYILAMRAGSIAATFLVVIAFMSLFILAWTFDATVGRDTWVALMGYSFGVSSIGLFMRVGGGIFTKAADIGADLSSKSEEALCEDDYRNPACIADHVGDNVGGVVGKGADLYTSLAASTCAAFYFMGSEKDDKCEHHLHHVDDISSNWQAMMFPMLVTCSGLVVNLISLSFIGPYRTIKQAKDVERAFKQLLLVCALAEFPVLFVVAWASLPATFAISCSFPAVTPMHCATCTALGLLCGLVLAYMTEYYTSHRRHPVQQIAEAQKVSAATGIIFGLAVGYGSVAYPIFCLGLTILLCQLLAGPYGIALAAIGMLTVMTLCLTIEAYDSIADNASGIAEMSGLSTDQEGENRCEITDVLGGAGAIGNGYAVGVGFLVSVSLLKAFAIRAEITYVDATDVWYLSGLLLGAALPYAFSAVTMSSVGKAANEMVEECRSQFSGIIFNQKKPDYDRCIRISTKASLKKLGPAGLLVIGCPLVVGFALGKKCAAGLLMGALVCGMQMAISMINTGGAFDNAKKHVTANATKGSEHHQNAVTGDTVGDPLKDVSGPSLNVLVNLCAITTLIFAPFINRFSASDGGPFWLGGFS